MYTRSFTVVTLQTLGQHKLEHLGPAQTQHPGPVKNLGAPKTVHILKNKKTGDKL